MRKTLLVVPVLASWLCVIHCSSNVTPHLDEPAAPSDSSTPTTSSKTKKTPPPTEVDPTPTPTHPAKAPPSNDAGTKASGPGASCQALSTCCSKISNSTQQTSCLQTAGKANEQVCTAAQTTFACSTLGSTPPARGPSCTGLVSGALYCGNDGPGGDPTTLYLCTGTTISISRVCPNGCTTVAGFDDACAAATAPPPAATASCKGLSGDYCGTDAVGGSANTLYTCANDAISATQVCPNGCVTNPDATLNDTCAAAPTTTTVSCTDLQDLNYCGEDLGGDSNTLYTCAGGTLTGQRVCSSGCAVAAANVSDYCISDNGADCAGETDGTYCGSNGLEGDPDTLYTCQDGIVQPNPTVCTFGCFSGDFGGSDSCN